MKMALIQELEELLSQPGSKRIEELQELIKLHAYADAERIMEQVNMYIKTRNTASQEAIEGIIESLKNS